MTIVRLPSFFSRYSAIFFARVVEPVIGDVEHPSDGLIAVRAVREIDQHLVIGVARLRIVRPACRGIRLRRTAPPRRPVADSSCSRRSCDRPILLARPFRHDRFRVPWPDSGQSSLGVAVTMPLRMTTESPTARLPGSQRYSLMAQPGTTAKSNASDFQRATGMSIS